MLTLRRCSRWIFLTLLSVISILDASTPAPVVYVIPIRDEIEQTMEYLVRRGVKEAMEMKAEALVLHMETNGGRVDCTERIISSLDQFKPNDKTYTFIDKKAISAGAFISSATRHIYMAPGSVIGAAAPVLAMPGQGPQALPESYEEKITSAIRAMVRSSAENHGHRPEVFDAMVDRNQGLKVDGKIIVPEGKLLTLTTKEAEQKIGGRPLLSKGTVENLDLLIQQIAGSNAKKVTLEPTGFETFARFLTMISPFLLTAGMVLGYLEFKTPGLGIFGILAGVCFVIYFFGHYVAGLSGHEPFVIFLLGVLLIVAELYFFPGLVIPTICGILLILFSFAFSKVDFYPTTDSIIPTWSAFEGPLLQTVYAILAGFLGMMVVARLIPSRWVAKGLEEATVAGPSLKKTVPVERGEEGVATTILRPSGTAEFQGRSLDVVTTGGMIDSGARVRVVDLDGYRIVVEQISENQSS